ncbi:MAG TPA: hypothetical protein P5125_06645 [Kiritimatiellia bacterium]|nr:hypothetical protein [Kiritimatiellia bacterium]
MIALARKIKARLGRLWWYTAILFLVLRACDLCNAFIGLWLVPRYVPQDELGAVLPLTQVGGVLGLPLAILLVPFTKFLNTYATRGEYGKVKRLLRDVFVLSLLLFVGTLCFARFILPLVFERMRVGAGSLGLLIVASGVLSVLSPLFINALQALQQFRMVAVINLIAAPIRLLAMWIAMPFRALSGYFVGQSAPSLFLIGASLFGLRRHLGREVRSEPYWQKDWHSILRYTLPVAMMTVANAVQTAVESFVIRHRLSELDSAGYYVISRFAEIGAYVGLTFMFVLFPLAAERHERGKRSDRYLWHAIGGTLVSGLILTGLFALFGEWLLRLNPVWSDYAGYGHAMVVLTLVVVARTAASCFTSHEMACGRFGFVCGFSLIAGIECAVLYGLTGVSFFYGILPTSWVDGLASLQAGRLEFILNVMLASAVALCAYVCLHEFRRRRQTTG